MISLTLASDEAMALLQKLKAGESEVVDRLIALIVQATQPEKSLSSTDIETCKTSLDEIRWSL